MITPLEAWNVVTRSIVPLPTVCRKLADLPPGVLAKPIVADRDLPPTNRSAMDGYALRAADMHQGTSVFSVCGEVVAGGISPCIPDSGQCVKIYTGAPLPTGLDTVVKVEDTLEADFSAERITLSDKAQPLANVLLRGEQAKKGDVIVEAGTPITPMVIAAATAVGVTESEVFSVPLVTILTTGKELRGVGDDLQPHQIRDSNGPMLLAALHKAGFQKVQQKMVPDDTDATLQALQVALATSDVVIFTGGVSVGSYDCVPAAVRKSGATINFHKVAIKPGKPLLFATSVEGKPIWGLPGNPLSSAVAFYEFVLPSIRLMAGYHPVHARPSLTLPLATDVKTGKSRQHYILARLENREKGPCAVPIISTGSADLVAGVHAVGMAIMPHGNTLTLAGTRVDYRPWNLAL